MYEFAKSRHAVPAVRTAVTAPAPAPPTAAPLGMSGFGNLLARADLFATDAAIQRFTVKRGDRHEAKKKAVIRAQNARLGALKNVYISEPDHAGVAFRDAGVGLTEAVSARTAITPSTNEFVHTFAASFQTEERVYDVELIAAVDISKDEWEGEDIWARDQDELIAAAERRVGDSFVITKVRERVDRSGHMNRPFTGEQAWATSSNFSGLLLPPGSSTPQRVDPSALSALFNLPLSKHIGAGTATAPLVPVPASSDDIFRFFVPSSQDTSWAAPSTREEFDEAFDNAPEGSTLTQSGRSERPKVSRKKAGSKRDPGKTLKASAHSFMTGGFAPPKKGKLASHEWCHIVGDGDNGKCAPENLYVGTCNVNTEQLALEEGLRDKRKALRVAGYDIYIQGRVFGEPIVTSVAETVAATEVEYEIWLQPRGRNAVGPRIDVLTRIMNGQRGSTPELQFIALKSEVHLLLESVLGRLRFEQRPRSPELRLDTAPASREVRSSPWFGRAFPALAEPVRATVLKRRREEPPTLPTVEEEPVLEGADHGRPLNAADYDNPTLTAAIEYVRTLNAEDAELFEDAIVNVDIDFDTVYRRFARYEGQLIPEYFTALERALDFT